MQISRRAAERGAAALIVVIFSILLLVTVSLGFMRLVVRDQQRTIDDELSRGAYDAALAGVEDGKRILQACIANGNTYACDAINANRCNSVYTAGILAAPDSTNEGEVLIKSTTMSDDDAKTYDQAYTCVKVQRDTDFYERNLLADISQVIPLNTVSSFTSVDVSWFQPPPFTTVDANTDPTTPLPAQADWAPASGVRPPILRVQLIQYNDGDFNLEDFDETAGGSTLYLYPSTVGASFTAPLDFALDARFTQSTTGLIGRVACTTTPPPYACNVRLNLPNPVDGSDTSRKAYLRITAIYGDTQVKVSAVGTQLHDVQPTIDSTGRASDVFRRIKANVEIESPFNIYPRATVDITKNFCKDFSVSTSTYVAGTCNPTQP